MSILLLLHHQNQAIDEVVLAQTKLLTEVFKHIHPRGQNPR